MSWIVAITRVVLVLVLEMEMESDEMRRRL